MSTKSKAMVENVNSEPEDDFEEIFESIHTLMHLIRSEQYKVLRDCPYQLTHMEGKILGFFARHPGATLSDLVADCARDKGQLANIIKTLRKHALLTSTPAEGDRRSLRLVLTKEGRKVHDTLRRELRDVTKGAIGGMPSADRTELIRLLRNLRAQIEAP